MLGGTPLPLVFSQIFEFALLSFGNNILDESDLSC
jgi:hypothetical protein